MIGNDEDTVDFPTVRKHEEEEDEDEFGLDELITTALKGEEIKSSTA